jgi:hydrogenase expression/formation protein HypD
MEVCGTHTMAIARSGLRSMLPDRIHLLSGPGCPVCVTPQETIDYAIALARRENIIIATFGDMVRVPGSMGTLEQYSPRIIYSPLDALAIAKANPGKDIVFIGVGFETTSPTIAATICAAEKHGINNFYVLPAFKTIPPALDYIAMSPRLKIHGFILPGHVSAIIGSKPYEFIARKYRIPGCITGFEPIDILQGILDLVRQLAEGEAQITIQYRKVVTSEGNKNAQQLLKHVFKTCDAKWRGIGQIRSSGYSVRSEYAHYDVAVKYPLKISPVKEPPGCICGKVLLGVKLPYECALFSTQCTPFSPIGPCMVSSEGACAAYYKYGSRKK